MPAFTKDKRIETPARIHPRSLTNNDVKRLGPSQRLSTKRIQTQSIQTQTILACVILHEKYKQTDEGTQTDNKFDNYGQRSINGFASRLVRFFGGTIVSFMKLFNSLK